MSNHLAIAAVSAVLRSLVDAAIHTAFKATTPKVTPGPEIIVTTGRPEGLQADAKARVNLFLFQVTPNAAWRNADLPTRRSDGAAVQRPQAAFDLHYLISFAGDETKQVPERLLGAALAVLHAQPILSRKMISDLVADPANAYLSASDLADQIELVRLVPLPLTIDELSKLWSVFFQIPYRLSVAWQASVVLLDMDVTMARALPVLSRHIEAKPLPETASGQETSEADRPRVENLSLETPSGSGASRTLEVTVASPVLSGQRVLLLLNEHGVPEPLPTRSFAVLAPPRTVDVMSLVFPLPAAAAAGTYLVRIEVDGVESLLELEPNPNDPDGPVQFSRPRVTIP